ncbi:MAG: hypothetical protein LBN41_01890 [Enterobacteriaceae bacterium]|nr:hypothetical protein [Enterobacteriaceae bacterium]
MAALFFCLSRPEMRRTTITAHLIRAFFCQSHYHRLSFKLRSSIIPLYGGVAAAGRLGGFHRS